MDDDTPQQLVESVQELIGSRRLCMTEDKIHEQQESNQLMVEEKQEAVFEAPEEDDGTSLKANEEFLAPV